jgi:hypothetical protein
VSALDAARRDLSRQAHLADGDEHRILSPLATVADMVCRIGSHADSAHYRADKAGDLVDAALLVELACLEAFIDDDDDERDVAAAVAATARLDVLDRASDLVKAVVADARRVMWVAARATGMELDGRDVARLRRTAAEFARWADDVTRTVATEPVR